MKLSRRKFIILLSSIVGVLLVSLSALVLMFKKDRTYFTSQPYEPDEKYRSEILVLYYSRSGNTEAMAREIARRFRTDIKNIKARSYSLDFRGWWNAFYDSWYHQQADIEPKTFDLSNVSLIFLGSPIWWYRPAPPLWAFVENNTFHNKAVVLFNTFNSEFKTDEIKAFQALVEKRGGRFIDHVYVRRGRILSQMSGRELLEKVHGILDAKGKTWPI